MGIKRTNLWRIENGAIRLNFSQHPGQQKAWLSERRFNFIIAGLQGGKTSFLPWWLLREIYDPDIGKGKGDYLAVSATYRLFDRKFLPEMIGVFVNLMNLGRWWPGKKIMELKDPDTGQFWAKRADDAMWGRVILGAATSPGGLESATTNAAILDECGQDDFTLAEWEAVQGRLSLTQGRVMGATTPYNMGWLKTEIWDAWENGDPDIELVNFPSYQNPAFPRAEYDRMQAKMQDWRFEMRYDGKLRNPAGLIYACFDSFMLVDPFPIPPEWERIVGVDFGSANTATLWLAQDPDSEIWYLYDESLEGGKTSREHAEIANAKAASIEDVSAVGGGPSEVQSRLDWADSGFLVDAPFLSKIEDGIDRGTELIKSGRFRVFRSCAGFRAEIGAYRRKLTPDGQVLDTIINKARFHRLDAFRYAAIRIIEGGGQYLW